MKITDVSSSTAKPSTSAGESPRSNETQRRKRSLLEKYDIPIEHLDFKFVQNCKDARKVERILRILRSGEEGSYPELQRFVESRLSELNPKSKLLRVEIPVLRTNELDKELQQAINTGLNDWLNDFTAEDAQTSSQHKSNKIFTQENGIELYKAFPIPVRGSSAQVTSTELNNKPFTTNANKKSQRIKSWEYDKWDKYNVDAELTKLDITDMQVEEWEKREKPKVLKEQKQIEKLMKETGDEAVNEPFSIREIQIEKKSEVETLCQKPQHQKSDKTPSRSLKTKKSMSVDERSYIEEVNMDSDDDDEAGTTVTTQRFIGNTKNSTTFSRRRIVIDDLNLAM